MTKTTYTAVENKVSPILSAANWTPEEITAWIHGGWTRDDEEIPDLAAWAIAAEQAIDEN